jgi:hypothetical protein
VSRVRQVEAVLDGLASPADLDREWAIENLRALISLCDKLTALAAQGAGQASKQEGA